MANDSTERCEASRQIPCKDVMHPSYVAYQQIWETENMTLNLGLANDGTFIDERDSLRETDVDELILEDDGIYNMEYDVGK